MGKSGSLSSSPDFSSGLMAGAGRRLAPFVASEYDGSPTGGPGAGGATGPGVVLPGSQGRLQAGQGACGSASIRCHAAVIASAHGQEA
jgi:hypothetical protein